MQSPAKRFKTATLGIQHELLFAYECMDRGLICLDPFGNYLPWDVMVLGPSGKTYKVQVKATNVRAKSPRSKSCHYNVHTSFREAGIQQPLSPAEADVLAVYIIPLKRWYLRPIPEIKGKTLSIRPDSDLHKTYFSNWFVFA